MAMGGFGPSSVMESNPVFFMPEKWLLQQASRQTIWTNASEHWNFQEALDSAILLLNFNPELVLRIISTATMDVEWESSNIQDFQQAQGKTLGQQALGIGGI